MGVRVPAGKSRKGVSSISSYADPLEDLIRLGVGPTGRDVTLEQVVRGWIAGERGNEVGELEGDHLLRHRSRRFQLHPKVSPIRRRKLDWHVAVERLQV